MKKVYLFICFLLTSTLVVQAQKTWTGAAGDTLWHTAGNWNPSGVPTASDSVIINNSNSQIIYFSGDASAKNINLRGSANVMFALKGVAASTVRNINLGGTISSDYNTTALQFSGSLGSLTLNTNRTSGTNSGIKLNILTGNKATITKTIHLSGFWGPSTLTASQDSISSSQSNGIIGVDAGSVLIGNGGAVVVNQRNNGTNGTTPFTGSATNGIVFQSGSTMSNYTASAVNPFTTASGTGTAQFLAGSRFLASLSTAAPVTNFNSIYILGRTYGSFFTGTMTQAANAVYTNTTTTTTTFLDSLVVNPNGAFLITLVGDATNVATPTYSFGGIRVSSTLATPNTTLAFRSSNTGGATAPTSINISGNISLASTASNTAAGTLQLVLGPNSTTQLTDLNINFTGTTSINIERGATIVNPNLTFGSPNAGSTGHTVFNINNGATLNLGDSISFRSTAPITKFNVKPTGKLTLIDNAVLTTNNNGYAILESDTTGSATIGNSVGKLINSFIVRRFIGRNAAWRTLGFPLNSTTLSGTNPAGTNSIDLNTFTTPTRTSAWAYYYDETADDGSKYGTTGGVNAGWKPITTSTSGLSARNGLLLYGSRNLATAITISDTGFINYGDQVIPLTKTVNGWNLVANPYPSNISFTSIAGNSENTGVLTSNTVYRVRPLGGGAYSWASYVSGSGTGSNGGSDVIENGAAFFVQAAATSNLTIKESNKTTNAVGSTSGGVSLLGGNDNYNTIRLNLTGANTFSDEVVFVWGRFTKATDAFDADFDAYDLGASGTHDLSIVGNDDTRYAIFNGTDLPKTAETRVYKLAVKALKAGTYEFTASMPKDLDRNNEAYLVDKFLNKATLVKEGMQVSFDVTADAASKAEDRFQLEVRKKLTSVVDEIASSKTYLLSNPISNNQFAIHFGSDAQVANWQVVDLSGRIISAGVFKNVYQGDTRVAELKALQSGTYLVRLFNDNEQTAVMKLVKL